MMGLARVGPDGSPAHIWPDQLMAIIGVAGSMLLFWAATQDKARSINFIRELNPDQPQVPLCLALACQGVGQLLAPELVLSARSISNGSHLSGHHPASGRISAPDRAAAGGPGVGPGPDLV